MRVRIYIYTVVAASFVAFPTAAPPVADDLETLPVTGVEPDHGMVEALAKYKVEVDKLDGPIGTSTEAMPQEQREGPLGSWIADRMLEGATAFAGKPVDVAFTNCGGIRADLPGGVVSYAAIMEILPFNNTLTMVEMKGNDVKALFTELAKRKSNLPIAGAEITATEAGEFTSATVGGKPLDDDKVYTVATNSYLATGGGGMEMLGQFPQQDSGILLSDVAIAYIQAKTKAGEKIEPPANPYRYRFGGKTIKELNP